MQKVLIPNIAKKLFENTWGKVCIDSRLLEKDDVFLALPGSKNHGNTFIAEVLEKGAALVIADAAVEHVHHKKVISVEQPDEFLWELSAQILSLSHARRIAITGSNGKTTTKDMMAIVLGSNEKVLKTQGNYNNQLGVPLTLCRLKKTHEIAVIEIGTSFPGEIERLTGLVQPEYSVITSINRAHLAGFKCLTAIALEKSQIFRAAPFAMCFLRSEDLKHRPIRQAIKNRDFTFFDLEEHLEEPTEHRFSSGYLHWTYHGEKFSVASPAQHNIENAQAAISVGMAMGNKLSEIKERLTKWRAPDHRMCLLNWKKRKILDDCYNANPASVLAALETAVAMRRNEQQRIFVALGDMKEMGRRSRTLHRELGIEMARMGVDALITLGDYAKESLLGYERSGGENFRHCENVKDMAEFIQYFSRPYDIILIKASRSMQLEKVIVALDEAAPTRRQQLC